MKHKEMVMGLGVAIMISMVFLNGFLITHHLNSLSRQLTTLEMACAVLSDAKYYYGNNLESQAWAAASECDALRASKEISFMDLTPRSSQE